MLYRKTSPMVACLCLAALHAAAAQTGATSFSQSLSATGGVTLSQHLDASASPMPFSGAGVESRIRYERTAGRWDASLTIDGARRIYTSRADAGTSVRERSYDGALNAALLRAFGGNAANGCAAGLAVDVRGGLLSHYYADPAATTSDYVHGYALVGPAVQWRQSMLGGIAIARVSVPAFGIAHHPYTDVRIDQAGTTFRTVSPATLRGYDASIRFESSARRRVGLVAEFSARALDYADIQRSRMAATGLSAGVVMRFGRTRP
jgi:hypothetical protein